MNFRARILMLPASAAAVFLVGCVISYLVGAQTSSALDLLRAQAYPALEAVVKVERGVENFRLTLQSAASEGDPDKLKDVDQIAAGTMRTVDELAKIEGQNPLATSLRKLLTTYHEVALGATRAMMSKGEVGDQLTRMQSSMSTLDKTLMDSKTRAAQAVSAAQDAAAAGVKRNLWVLLVTCAAALVALGVASQLIITSVWRDLGAEPALLGEAMRRIADGDLATRDARIGDVADGRSVSAALNAMTERLRETLTAIHNAADSIHTSSGEIAGGNRDLSTRTEHTAADLQQAASALEQVTGTVSQTAGSSGQANQLAGAAADAARSGGQIVNQVVANMNEIKAASGKITEIIGVIDGIAFQTNILALNAAVEAARAGEQGRGFAVVASEVRSLAQRSAQAAKEIKTLINVSTEKVESGTRLVRQAGTAMQDIMSGVQHVTSVIAEISAAASEQSTGITHVNQSVSRVEQMTQQNAALVEQSSAAAASLLEQTGRLAAAVAAFRLTGVEAAVPTTGRAQPAAAWSEDPARAQVAA